MPISKSAASETTSSGTVARIALLLRVLAEAQRESSLGDIAARMKLPASTTHRLLNLLLDEGYVERGNDSRSYRVGLEFVRVAGLVMAGTEITDVAATFMQAVADTCDETCMLCVHMPREQTAMIAKVIYGSHPLRYEAVMYRPSSLLWGATGRGILAFLPPETIEAVLALGEPSPGNHRKKANPAQIRKELAQIREQGYALTHGQKIPGAVGMSVPVFNTAGVVASLCLTLPESRFTPTMEPRFARVLMQQADRFSSALGGTAPARAAKTA